jgi:2-dehydropantoate 2-reductase
VPAALVTGATVIPFLNGVDHLPYLRAVYPAGTVAGTVVVEATKLADGRIEQASRFATVTIAVPPGPAMPGSGDAPPGTGPAAAAAGLLDVPGLRVTTHPGETQVLWQKLCMLATFALLTTAAGQPIGAAREQFADWVSPLAREACAAAAVHGAAIDPAAIEAQIRGLPGEMRSSMLKDRLAGRELELDAIAGPTLRTLGPAAAPVTLRAVRAILDAG